jgi:SAM-dependent methyltransferase
MAVNRDWWKKFYSGTWQYIHSSFRTQERTAKEADFIEGILRIKPPARILDVPCGEGRLSIELASRGYKVTGVDFNKHFLMTGETIARKEGLVIVWHQGDMRDLHWKDAFDAVICMWQSFGYFDDQGNQEFIKAVSRSLKKGGHFLLDTQAAETLYPVYKTEDKFRIAGVKAIVNRYMDHETSRNMERFTFTKKGKRRSYHSSIRIYTYQEVANILGQNAFSQIKSFGSFSRDPFRFGASRLLMVVRRD